MNLPKKVIEIPCAIYTRVSTEDQLHAVYGSIEKQQDMCALHIKAQEGWSLQQTYSDPAVSGKEWDRDGLQAMLAAVASGKIKMVVGYHTSRLSRKLVDTMRILEHLYSHGCGCYSLREGFIDISTPESRYFAAQRAAQNELDHGKIVQAVQDGVIMKVASGKRSGGRAPWGYVNDTKNSVLIPDPVIGKIVRRVFESVAAGETLGSIANKLNGEGVRTPFYPNARNGKGSGGRLIDTDFLWTVIKNVAHKGYGRTKASNQAHIPKPDAIDAEGRALYKASHYENRLVDEALWDLANAKARQNMRQFSSEDAFKRRGDSPLIGMVKCGHCRCGMSTLFTNKKTSQGIRHHRYYRCQKLVDEGKEHQCRVRQIAAELFESIVIESLNPLGKHSDIIAAAVTAAALNKRDHATESRMKLRETEAELRKLKEQESNLIAVLRMKGAAALSEKLISEIDQLNNAQTKLGQERRALATTVAAAEENFPSADSIAAGISNVKDVVMALSAEKRHELLRFLIADITVFKLERVPVGASQPIADSTTFLRFLVRLRGSRAYLLGLTPDPSSVRDEAGKREPLMVPIQLDVEIPFRWQSKGYRYLSPFNEQVVPAPCASSEEAIPFPVTDKRPHALAKAIAWAKELRENPECTQTMIAGRENMKRASVCQYLRLLKLPLAIRTALLAPGQAQQVLEHFGLRQLLLLFKKPEGEREAEFKRQLKQIKNADN